MKEYIINEEQKEYLKNLIGELPTKVGANGFSFLLNLIPISKTEPEVKKAK